MTTKEDSDGGRVLVNKKLEAEDTCRPCMCLHGCMSECVLPGSVSVCVHETNTPNVETKEGVREATRRS